MPTIEVMQQLRSLYKLSKTHLYSVVEIAVLRRGLTPKQFDLYRIWVKKRLYRKNEEILGTMAPELVKEKLNEVFGSVYEDYQRIFSLIK